jgi:hypothetical protein
MSKDVAKVWEFASSSNPNNKYETLQYTDGSTSCNCPGWTRRVDATGNRSCKHTRMVDMGSAERESSAFHDYTKVSGPKKVTMKANLSSSKKEDLTVTPVRKVLWNKNG